MSEARKGGGILFGMVVMSVYSTIGIFGSSLNGTPLTIANRNDVHAATSGVKGNSHQCVESESLAYAKFVQALYDGQVCIANRASPYVPK